MRKTSHILSTIFLLIGLTACGKNAYKTLPAPAKMQSNAMAKVGTSSASDQAQQSPETRRYIALKHEIEVEYPAANIQPAFDATLKQVEELGGELLDASINSASEYASPSANISLRLPPNTVEKFLEGIAKSGKVLRHQRQAEDKTDQVIDADARIANLTELRNRLRRMLAEKPAQIKDVIEIEKQLAETQSSLEAISGVRKSLSKQTDFVALDITFRSAQEISKTGFFSPVASAWNDAGSVLMASLGGLITFIAALLPWLLILIPAFLLIRKAWRSWRNRDQLR